MEKPQFQIIQGRNQHENEKLFQRLLNEPHTFEQQEFENLVDYAFRSRLSFGDIERLIAKRIKTNVKDTLERNALLAIINGDIEESGRLHKVIKRRNQLGLRVVS
jgi:hypothetical protein